MFIQLGTANWEGKPNKGGRKNNIFYLEAILEIITAFGVFSHISWDARKIEKKVFLFSFPELPSQSDAIKQMQLLLDGGFIWRAEVFGSKIKRKKNNSKYDGSGPGRSRV